MGRQRRPVCAACGSTVPKLRVFKVCSGCDTARYCDRECQTAHWPVHKQECGAGRRRAAAEGSAALQGALAGRRRCMPSGAVVCSCWSK